MSAPPRIRISSVPMIGDFALPSLMQMSMAFPSLELIYQVSRDVVEFTGEPIVALRAGTPAELPGMICRRIGTLHTGLYGTRNYVASHGYPDLRDGMRGLELVWPDEEHRFAPWERWLLEHGRNSRIIMKTDDEMAQRSAVRSGRCAGFLPISALLYVHDLVELCPAQDSWIDPLWLVTHEDNMPRGIQRDAVDFLADLLRRSLE